jgi:hypothetical protein
MTHRRGSSISTAVIQAAHYFLNRIAVPPPPSYDLPTKISVDVSTADLLAAKKFDNNSSINYGSLKVLFS